jgi:predicted acetyltransferase
MLRLLDVPAALEGLGYPPASGEAVLEIEDELFPENRGPWRIVANAGEVEVSRAEDSVRPMRIGTLSSMYSGYLSPRDAIRLGLAELEPSAVELLERLFAGPPAFMYEFF